MPTLALAANVVSPPTALVDHLVFGDDASETSHGFQSKLSDVIHDGLGEPARRLLPGGEHAWEGGTVTFKLKVDPAKLNYVTIKLWGSDVNPDHLILFCVGKQIGYRHLGDIEILDLGTDAPMYNGRFVYQTAPLPEAMTKGQTELTFEIHCTGPAFNYASTFAVMQKDMTVPTRGLYCLYTHTDGYFVPPVDEKQGADPANAPIRSAPGAEVLDQLKQRVDGLVDHLLDGGDLNQEQVQFLAKAYYVKWTPAYQAQKTVDRVTAAVDHLYLLWIQDPPSVEQDKGTWNPGWFAAGPSADAVRLLAKPLGPSLEQEIDDGKGGKIKRRDAWSQLFLWSLNYERTHRRLYTNQTMIVDGNLYMSNRALQVVDPAKALPEEKALRYIYEAVGIQPWLGNDTDKGSEKPMGDNYYQVTEKGLTRELGYVGYYGEVLDWVGLIYDATRDPGQEGDPKIKAQMIKLAHARSIFRYPALDDEGNRAMRIETLVGWRDFHYPGDVTYGLRRGSPFLVAAVAHDPESVGVAQQMLDDNQFFAALQFTLKDTSQRSTMEALLEIPDDYAAVKSLGASPKRLPMTPGQPDFVWSDETDGVLAVKNGGDILYASLYWRAIEGINHLAKVHYLTSNIDRIAVVQEETKFEDTLKKWIRPNWTNFFFAGGGPAFPVELHSAHQGEELPIAAVPSDVGEKITGMGDVYKGRGEFYTLRYGPYLIGMNMTSAQSYLLLIPANVISARNLGTGETISPGSTTLTVGPKSTVVLYLDK